MADQSMLQQPRQELRLVATEARRRQAVEPDLLAMASNLVAMASNLRNFRSNTAYGCFSASKWTCQTNL